MLPNKLLKMLLNTEQVTKDVTEKNTINMVKAMIKENISLDIISKVTNKSIEEIKKMLN